MIADTVLNQSTEQLLELELVYPCVFLPAVDSAITAKAALQHYTIDTVITISQHLQHLCREFLADKKLQIESELINNLKNGTHNHQQWPMKLKEGPLTSNLAAILKNPDDAQPYLTFKAIQMDIQYPQNLDILRALMLEKANISWSLKKSYAQYPCKDYYWVLALAQASQTLAVLEKLKVLPSDDAQFLTIYTKACINMNEAVQASHYAQLLAVLHDNSQLKKQLTKHQQLTQTRAQKGAKVRSEKYQQLRQFVIDNYHSKHFQSIRQAAKHITPKAIEHARLLNINLSTDNAENTLYRWLLSAKKAHLLK